MQGHLHQQQQQHHHHHHLQQQLAALLSAACSRTTTGASPADSTGPIPSSSVAAAAAAAEGHGERGEDSSRLAALDSLHRTILYPPNSILLSQSAPFLSQGLSQLLSDKSYAVRRAAAVAYGSLCAVVCSTSLASNGIPNHVMAGGLVDRFIAQALPLLAAENGSSESATDALQEFLKVGDAASVERHVPSILKACQELLEDDRTSLSFLQRILGLMTLISLKFPHCFQANFVDVVDLLLGWALVPDLPEPDRRVITDSFLQFQKHWLSNLHFSLGLLSKFLGDMEVLLQDRSLEMAPQLGGLLALFSCFSTVLQATASGMFEMNLFRQISEPVETMAPRLLRCISMYGIKFGRSKSMGEPWRCLILLAEILQEKFADLYPTAVDILFRCLRGVPSFQVHSVLKTNLQLLNLQKQRLLPSSVQAMLQFSSPLSQLRLHPNHLIVASSAATYLFFLHHSCEGAVSQAITSLIEDLGMLRQMLGDISRHSVGLGRLRLDSGTDTQLKPDSGKGYSDNELISLIKFDLNLLLSCVSDGGSGSLTVPSIIDTTRNERAARLTSFILEELDPFDLPVQDYLELQVHVFRALHKLSIVEFSGKHASSEDSSRHRDPGGLDWKSRGILDAKGDNSVLVIEPLRKFSSCLVKALNTFSPITIKLEALDWIHTFASTVASVYKDVDLMSSSFGPCEHAGVSNELLISIVDVAYDREVRVRSCVASVLETLLQARLIFPGNFQSISELALDRLSDPDLYIKNAFVRLLAISLPLTIYACGFIENGSGVCSFGSYNAGSKHYANWKRVLALKQLPRKLHSQQLVSILSYISQRWKVPLSTWVQRLVFSCRVKKDGFSTQQGVVGDLSTNSSCKNTKEEVMLLDVICPVNLLAAAWWSIHEAARYCITLRLRTNLGGPTQTFAALERMLLDIPNVLLLDSEQSESKYLGSSNVHLLPMRLLLDFVETLKKNVYNAYEGSSVLPAPPRQSSLFFRANRKVCEEWFSRIRVPMLNVGLALHCHDATFHYCAIRLQELRSLVMSVSKETRGIPVSENPRNHKTRFSGDVLKVLRDASLALCRNHEPEALIGLQKWAAVAFPSLFMGDDQLSSGDTGSYRHFSWMTGLVYQAQGQYEKAAAHYSHLLQTEEELSYMGSDGIQFVIARVIESHTSLSDWKSLETWLTELQALRARHAGKEYSGALTAAGNEINAVHAMARFEEGDVQAAKGYLDLTPTSSNELTLDPKAAVERSEQMLLRSMLQRDDGASKVNEELEKAKLMLDEVLSIIPLDGLAEAAACATQLHCIFAFEEGTRSNDHKEAKHFSTILDSLHQVLLSPISTARQDCSSWIKIFRVFRTLRPASFETIAFCQNLLRFARKQSNFMLAHRLNQYIRDHSLTFSDEKQSKLLAGSMQYESILLKHAECKHEEALLDLWSFVRTSMLSVSTSSNIDKLLQSKACLKLSTWLRRDNSDINLRNILLKMHEDFHICNAFNGSSSTRSMIPFNSGILLSDENCHVILEEIVGTATKVSCNLSPCMVKSWLSYASWCFSQARMSLVPKGAVLESCSLSSVLHQEVPTLRFQLTDEEMTMVKAIITDLCSTVRDIQIASSGNEDHIFSTLHPKDEALVNSLIQRVTYIFQATVGAPGFESTGECPSASLSSQLEALLHCAISCTNKSDILAAVNKLVNIWWSLRKRRVSLFGHAAHGYFRYLSCSSSKLQESNRSLSHFDIVKEKSRSCTLRAMLYILHILLNYGVELRETFEHGFAAVPLWPWQEIIPQLFARLSSHPKDAVRKQLEDLLTMLAKISPWSIVYPLVVDINAYEGGPSEELQHVLDYLGKLYPKLVQDVQLVVNELGMMTVLWEELWLSTLQDLHSDVVRRINTLKEEASRISENSTLSHAEKVKINAAKYSAMMAPIVVALERRLASTSREPRTDHETWFQKEYGEQLRSAIFAFKMPPLSATALGDVWRPFDAIASSLAAYQRKSFISLRDVAPQLTLISSSDVPMPGFEKQISMLDSSGSFTANTQGVITISSFCEEVIILSTKTRPKKLVLLGSDGQKYTYLLKGREDLRLDARIMQLLQAVNSFLYSCIDSHSRSLAIRYYSVTPISGRAGLIQWVDDVTSIYSVYKSWQNRTQLAELSAVGAGNLNSQVPPVPRPSDMFYGKIIPALKEKGIRRVISRRDWPHEVKRKVLLELMKETPRQLIWQELWCASEGFKAFSSKTKRFSGTVAAMSMVGHILGLGDRHLDNILMDFSTGDVVHIDYNVCFDKGRRLKIPEIVPFRLTQTIEAALGLTGTEGTFRANCEAVVSVLRKNKDIVLMLLEVFVWDPLVEWTRGDNHDEAAIGGEERKGMELAVSLSLFASRVQEIRVPLQEHHDLLLATLPAAESALKKLFDVLNKYEVISAFFYHADKERSSLLQQETSAKSILADATSTSEKSRSSFEFKAHEFAQTKVLAADKAQEAAMWVDQHGTVLDALRSGSIPDAHACISMSSREESLSLISAVVMSGVPLTVVPEPTQAQCYDLDREVCHLIAELGKGVSSAIDVLHEYALALQRVIPLNYFTTSPVHAWAQILKLSVSNLSSDVLNLTRRQAADLVARTQGDGLDLVQQSHQDLFQKMERYAMEIEKVENERSELINSIGSDTEANSKERLLAAFTKYMHSVGFAGNEDVSTGRLGKNKRDGPNDLTSQGDLEEKKDKVLTVLQIAANELYNEVKSKVLDISNNPFRRTDWRRGRNVLQSDSGVTFRELEEQIEKCALIATEVQGLVCIVLPTSSMSADSVKLTSEGNWASVFQACLHSSKHLIEQITEVALPEIIRLVISCNSDVMEAFGSLSQIRGSIYTALEKLTEVELERASLRELEKNYFLKVGLIKEQQLALEEAAVKGRDHLSWEEADELASQEEACQAQLDSLHQTWNQRDIKSSSLKKIEANIENTLLSSERYFSNLVSIEQGGSAPIRRSKVLLSALAKAFIEMESINQMLTENGTSSSSFSGCSFTDLITSGSSLSESVWKFSSILKDHSFFIWKVDIMDSILDLCVHDFSSSVDNSFGFDQLYTVLKKKLETKLREYVGLYLKERVAPALLEQLEREGENAYNIIEARKGLGQDLPKRDVAAVKKVQLMLEEHCNAHETARAARSAAFLMKRQVNELAEALRKVILEIVQMEWLHDLPNLLKDKSLPDYILGDDDIPPLVLNISRPKFLETLQSSMSSIARSMEYLQACERTSLSAEGQLERAMGWACGGPSTVGVSSSSVRSSGIPSEFHDHLLRRRQLLWAAREQASDIMRICTSVMELEASRDGFFQISGEKSSVQVAAESGTWQQAYSNILTRLDASYQSFMRAEQEWKMAQNNMESAANGFFTATNELHVASAKAKSASGDLQGILAAMRDCTYEASAALSAFSRVSKGHTALTSECGSMLEEVLAITEGLHDVHSLGKDAASAHSALMAHLSKANVVLLPLEVSLSTDVAAMSDALSKESENKMDIPPFHGQALYKSYCFRLREACHSLGPVVPSLVYSVEELFSLVTKLARISSLHAGNLHKALEGLGESQDMRSQEIGLSASELSDGDVLFKKESFLMSNQDGNNESTHYGEFSLQDEEWISPPEHTFTSSTCSSITSIDSSVSETSDRVEQSLHTDAGEDILFHSSPEKSYVGQESQIVKDKIHATGSAAVMPSASYNKLDVLPLSDEDVVTGGNFTLEKGYPEEERTSSKTEHGSSEQLRGHDGSHDEPFSCPGPATRVTRGKNAYALSVLRHVELKLEGRDIEDNRSLKISEQVDHLLKQATSIDNLCNMYEGWTPWI